MAGHAGHHTHEQISPNTWKVVESDRFGQFPFLYVRLGADKCIVVDTGCGQGDVREYIGRHINRAGLPYLVINTHVHFDVRIITTQFRLRLCMCFARPHLSRDAFASITVSHRGRRAYIMGYLVSKIKLGTGV